MVTVGLFNIAHTINARQTKINGILYNDGFLMLSEIKNMPEGKGSIPPLSKPLPAFESPLKDSYTNSSSLLKENTK